MFISYYYYKFLSTVNCVHIKSLLSNEFVNGDFLYVIITSILHGNTIPRKLASNENNGYGLS